jgi:hypothetical protein
MRMNHGDDVLIRRLDVTVRLGNAGGLLTETLIGRYLLDRDARLIWEGVDGETSVARIIARVAERLGVESDTIATRVTMTCEAFVAHGLAELVKPT